MDITTLLLLSGTVFAASGLQAATGMGYGVIAGPVFLVMLNGIAALQISTLHNLAIALMLTPLLRAHIHRSILRGLIGGSVLGIIAGFALQTAVSTTALKIAATVMVGFVTLLLLREMFSGQKNDAKQDVTRAEIVGVGTAAGLMGGMLAMPGPLAATWMSVRGVQKQQVRATTLAFFVFAYGANTLLYAGWNGLEKDTIKLAAILLPILGLGILAGSKLSENISEKAFRLILLFVLAATLALLISDWAF
ncbi:MAG: putative membrane protein YfcA [Akkermansiaceae bacterium]|jgi:uncharacterized membrane protein YfcA